MTSTNYLSLTESISPDFSSKLKKLWLEFPEARIRPGFLRRAIGVARKDSRLQAEAFFSIALINIGLDEELESLNPLLQIADRLEAIVKPDWRHFNCAKIAVSRVRFLHDPIGFAAVKLPPHAVREECSRALSRLAVEVMVVGRGESDWHSVIDPDDPFTAGWLDLEEVDLPADTPLAQRTRVELQARRCFRDGAILEAEALLDDPVLDEDSAAGLRIRMLLARHYARTQNWRWCRQMCEYVSRFAAQRDFDRMTYDACILAEEACKQVGDPGSAHHYGELGRSIIPRLQVPPSV